MTRRTHRLGGVLILMLLAAVALLSACGTSSGLDLDGLTAAELEAEKLRAEIRQLEREARRDLVDWAPVVTVMVAVGGTLLAFWRLIGERAADRLQRETESLRRLDERFAAATEHLGAESPAVQAGAAVTLRAFLATAPPPERTWRRRAAQDPANSLHEEVFSVVLANLKLPHDLAVRDELVRTFELAIRRTLAALPPGVRVEELNLARADLTRVDLVDLDLGERADLGFVKLSHAKLSGVQLPRARGFRAELGGAVLSRANLWEARMDEASGEGVYFHGADLKSAHLKGATLRGARFFQAQLQSAHFDRADLAGAHFEEADLNDAYFTGATLDEAALRSITRAHNWETAHFDPPHDHRLARLAAT